MLNQLHTWIGVADIIPYFAILSPNSPFEQVKQAVDDAEFLDLPKIFCEEMIRDIDSELQASPPFGTRPELQAFYNDFIKKLLAGLAICRYTPFIGLHVTQWGLERYGQEGMAAVSDKNRAELLNSFKGKTSAFETLALVALKQANSTFDGVKYSCGCECKPNRKRLPFSVVGAGNRNKGIHDLNSGKW